MSTAAAPLGQVSMVSIGSNYEVIDYFYLFMEWQKSRAALQNATAGPPEQKRRTIGREVAQGYKPSPPRWVKFGLRGGGPSPPVGRVPIRGGSPPAWVKFQRFPLRTYQ